MFRRKLFAVIAIATLVSVGLGSIFALANIDVDRIKADAIRDKEVDIESLSYADYSRNFDPPKNVSIKSVQIDATGDATVLIKKITGRVYSGESNHSEIRITILYPFIKIDDYAEIDYVYKGHEDVTKWQNAWSQYGDQND